LERLESEQPGLPNRPSRQRAGCTRKGVWSIQTRFRRQIRADEPKGPDLTAFEESGTATAVTGAITFESGSALVPPFRLVGLSDGEALGVSITTGEVRPRSLVGSLDASVRG
jgi:hypothetical protein